MKLLSHIARTVPQTENLATDALTFVLSKSVTARRALMAFLTHPAFTIPGDLTFGNQARDGSDTIPDVAGRDADGQERVFIEAKFWAGLTGNQPTAYLNRFTADTDCLLIFLVPEARQVTLWPKLVRLCQEAGMASETVSMIGTHWDCAKTGDHRFIGIMSWRRLLTFVSSELRKAGESDTADDLAQLGDLCDQMDQDAFLPLKSEELAPEIGRRVFQYCDLVDNTMQMLVHDGIAEKGTLKTRVGKGAYGQYITLKGCGCCLSFDSHLWSRVYETPLWLQVNDESWKSSPQIKKALNSLFAATPVAAYQFDGRFWIPLHLLLKAERQDIVRDLANQVASVAALLPDRVPVTGQSAGVLGGPPDTSTEAPS